MAVTVLAGSLMLSSVVNAAGHVKYRGEFGAEFPVVDTATGELVENPAYDPGVTGRVHMKVGLESTKVSVEVEGLDPELVYGSHLHDRRCADGGGGHYQDEVGGPVDSVNEIWLSSFETGFGILGAAPMAEASGAADWAARTTSADSTNALSVVIHAPGGARIACADLVVRGGRPGVANGR